MLININLLICKTNFIFKKFFKYTYFRSIQEILNVTQLYAFSSRKLLYIIMYIIKYNIYNKIIAFLIKCQIKIRENEFSLYLYDKNKEMEK